MEKPLTEEEIKKLIRQASMELLGETTQAPDFSAEIAYEDGEIAAILRKLFKECEDVFVKTPAQSE